MCTGAEALVIGSMLASTAVAAYSQHEQGQFQKDLGLRNKEQADLEAEAMKKEGLVAEEQHLSKVRRVIAAQRAILGASNVDINTGTAGQLQSDTVGMGTLDAETIRINAMRGAWGRQTQGMNDLIQGQVAGRTGTMSSFSTLLAGGARAYGQYSNYTK